MKTGMEAPPTPPPTSTNASFIHSQSLARVAVFTDHPELCTHKLAEARNAPNLHPNPFSGLTPYSALQMPRWLSSAKMEVVK